MISYVLRKIFGSKNERELSLLWPRVQIINELEKKYSVLDDAALQGMTGEFKTKLDNGAAVEYLLPDAFAVVREASKRVLGMRHFDVQLIGGMVLHSGKIAEMKTGEGKTLTATLPVYLNALSGKGVHVVTVNDYLARRDAAWMGQVYSFMGLETGVILHGVSDTDRQRSYAVDITYGQNNEFGFDYLRDNMKLELDEMVQRPHHYAIVDEVDSILVDEARTPLIISGPSEKPTDNYRVANELVKGLKEEQHFAIEQKNRQVTLTDEGVQYVEQALQLENLYDPKNIELVHHVQQALKAHVVMRRDVEYVSRNNQIIIVDEFTGRLMPGRRWSDGLHQAVEAKEGVEVQQENQTLATVTFQNYFRMYKKLAGMTGTADTEAVEFKKIYNLDVIVIPTNKPMIRADHPDVVFSSEKGKFNAVCNEIQDCVTRGQPVLVGTASIEKSELLSSILIKRNIKHHVLNAKQHEREAAIVAQAGRYSAITISTNMAGRGTDIILGGNAEFLAADEAKTKDAEDSEYQEQLKHYRAVCADEREKVVAAGGLHILGTERHESRRIDNQLRGRSGRQGDPGSSRFYVSLQDDLMKRFGGERMQAIMARVGLREDDAIEGGLVNRAIENAQKKVEGFHFDIRKHLLEYDDVMNKQREVIYKLREQILRSEGVETTFTEMVGDVLEFIIYQRVNEKEPVAKWDVRGIFADYQRLFGEELGAECEEFLRRQETANKGLAQELFDLMRERAFARYEQRKVHFGPHRMEKLQRIVFLQACDHFWKEHLSNMDHLKEGINLRGYAQRNPLHEYQRESFELFASMLTAIKAALIQNVFIPELPSEEELSKLEEQERELNKQREALARSVHEDVIDAQEAPKGAAVAAQSTDGSGNRHERRKQQAMATKGSFYTPKPSDYAPTKPQPAMISAAEKEFKKRSGKDSKEGSKRGK